MEGSGREEATAFRSFVAERTGEWAGGAVRTNAQVVGAVNRLAGPDDLALTAAGGLPGEMNVHWLANGIGTFDCEYGYSTMGYELAGAWGRAGEGARRSDRLRRRRLVPHAQLGALQRDARR